MMLPDWSCDKGFSAGKVRTRKGEKGEKKTGRMTRGKKGNKEETNGTKRKRKQTEQRGNKIQSEKIWERTKSSIRFRSTT